MRILFAGAVLRCNQSRGYVSLEKQTAPIGLGAVFELLAQRRLIHISTIATSGINFNRFRGSHA